MLLTEDLPPLTDDELGCMSQGELDMLVAMLESDDDSDPDETHSCVDLTELPDDSDYEVQPMPEVEDDDADEDYFVGCDDSLEGTWLTPAERSHRRLPPTPQSPPPSPPPPTPPTPSPPSPQHYPTPPTPSPQHYPSPPPRRRKKRRSEHAGGHERKRATRDPCTVFLERFVAGYTHVEPVEWNLVNLTKLWGALTCPGALDKYMDARKDLFCKEGDAWIPSVTCLTSHNFK